jgi:alpha/beta superfamily hydrolase
MKVEEVVFNGSEGRLEGKFFKSEEVNAPAVLLLHPHPLHGGTMNNKVIYTAFHTFARNKYSVLRFNFRGVGRSDGVFDHGAGELMDAATALDWLEEKCPEASSYWLVGFSFGAWISLQLLMRRPEIAGFIAISPPAGSHDFNFLSPCPAPGAIIQGTKDDIAKEEVVYKLFEKLDKQRGSDIEYFPIRGANHFFENQLDELSEVIENYMNPRVSLQALPKRVKRDRRRRQLPLDNEDFG